MKKTAKYFLIGCICFLSKTMLGATHGFFIKTDLIHEQNLLDVYQVRINQLISENGTLSEEDLAVLSNVAYQCDFVGGEAVQTARGILESLDDEKYHFDRDNKCPEEIIFKQQKVNSSDNVKLYPNPATAIITLNRGSSMADEFIIYDIYGRVVLLQSIDNQNTTINTSHLSNGVYYCRLFSKEAMIATLKFSVIQ